MLFAQLSVLFLVEGVFGFGSTTKIWIPDIKFDNPNNWDLKRVPCEKDRLIFPSNMDTGIALPTGTTILSEVILARNGELLLPKNGALQIGGGKTADVSKCPKGGDITFTRLETEAWLNPANWELATGSEEDLPSAVPHVDRIPCEHDAVRFKNDSSVKLKLPNVPITVGSMRLGNLDMSNRMWMKFLSTETSYRQFVGKAEDRKTSVTIRPPPTCTIKSGCVCNSAKPQRLLKAVCSYVKCKETLQCYEPITPYGHCCPICGASLLLKFDKVFEIKDLRELLQEHLKEDKYSNIGFHARKTAYRPGEVQIVLAEKGGYQGNSGDLATVLVDVILTDMDLGVTKVTTQSSGPVILGSKIVGAAETFFGTFFMVILTLALIFYVFVVNPKGLPFAHMNRELFQFARFQNAGEVDEVALVIDETEPMDVPAAHDEATTGKAFDNPMYGTTGIANKNTQFDSKNSQRETTHVNPLYSELKRRERIMKGGKQVEDLEEEVEKEEEEEVEEDSVDTVDEESDEEREREDEEVFDEILIKSIK